MTFRKTVLLACSALAAVSLLAACTVGQAAAPSSAPESSTSQPESSMAVSSKPDSRQSRSQSTSQSTSQSIATSEAPQTPASNRPAASSSQPPPPASSTPPHTQAAPEPAPQPQAAPEPCPEPVPQPTPQPQPEPTPAPPPAPTVDAGACIAEARAYALGKGMTEDGGLNTGNSGYMNPPDISTLSQASVIADLKYCIDVYAGYAPDDPSLVHFNIVQSGNFIYVLYQ